ncbi:unnamed protein product [Somion occarium]|uniref:NAD(P)-binding protein n=1 Tax=Somion occarium TaxID=3059160 RepID=A0ABP1CYB2_9APHY
MASYVVTGSNRGIGLAFIRNLSANPNNTVFALTRNKANSADLLELQSKLKNVHVLQADITDVPALREAAKEVERVAGGALDVLINNGAYLALDRGDFTLDAYDGKEDLLDKDFTDFFKVNTLGVIKTINVFLPLLRKASEKSLAKVITISTGASDLEFTVNAGFWWFAPYATSKSATNMVMAKYAAAHKQENILFLSISPGAVNSANAPPNEVEATFGPMIKVFQSGYPEWNVKDSGAFISQYGDKAWL